MLDLFLDRTTHDLVVKNGDLVLVDKLDELRQHLKIRLWWFVGEWYLNTGKGFLEFETILTKAPDLGKVGSAIKAVINGTQGIKKLLEFELDFDPKLRKIRCKFLTDTIYGKLRF